MINECRKLLNSCEKVNQFLDSLAEEVELPKHFTLVEVDLLDLWLGCELFFCDTLLLLVCFIQAKEGCTPVPYISRNKLASTNVLVSYKESLLPSSCSRAARVVISIFTF
jgi:hypothetical protein